MNGWGYIGLILVACAVLIGTYRTDRVNARVSALEAQVAAAEESRLTWAAVAQEAHELAEDNATRCSWTLLPAKDERALLDAVLVGCARRDGCRIEWALEDGIGRVGSSCDGRVRTFGAGP